VVYADAVGAAVAERFGPYILLDRINVGGMAEVFRAKHEGAEGFQRLVALKRILPNVSSDPDFIDMFKDEAFIAKDLRHGNIAQTYDFGKVDDQYYIAMEYVAGVDLRTMWDRARRRKRLLPIAMSAYIIQKVCEGLDAAHRKTDDAGNGLHLVHRDISPHNILCSFEGEVKVIDFGIAKVANKVSKTQAGALKGKFGYMSPEQVRGLDLDHRSDIFAVGTCLYELLVGRRLFRGSNDFSVLEKIRNVEFRPPSELHKGLDPRLEAMISKALQKSPEDRYAWASDMAEELGRYLYATDQPFNRTDLERYMREHFSEEQTQERARLERYRALSLEAPARPPAPAAEPFDEPPTEAGEISGAAWAPAVRPAAPGTRAQAVHVGPAVMAAEPGGVADGATGAPSSMVRDRSSTFYDHSRAPSPPKSLPTWAAMLIGALTVVAALSLAGTLWVAFGPEPVGGLTIEAVPADAEIYVDEIRVGTAPVELDGLSEGPHLIEVRAPGHAPQDKWVRIRAGQTRIESIRLRPQSAAGGDSERSTSPN
jgi:serine/threonine protein kinase